MKKSLIILLIIILLKILNSVAIPQEKTNPTNQKTKKTFLILIQEEVDNKSYPFGNTKSELILQNIIQKDNFNFINPVMLKNKYKKNKRLIISNPQKWLKKKKIKSQLKKLKIDFLITGKIATRQRDMSAFSKTLILYHTLARLQAYAVESGKLIAEGNSNCNDSALNKETANQKSITKAIKQIILINIKMAGSKQNYNKFMQDIAGHNKSD